MHPTESSSFTHDNPSCPEAVSDVIFDANIGDEGFRTVSWDIPTQTNDPPEACRRYTRSYVRYAFDTFWTSDNAESCTRYAFWCIYSRSPSRYLRIKLVADKLNLAALVEHSLGNLEARAQSKPPRAPRFFSLAAVRTACSVHNEPRVVPEHRFPYRTTPGNFVRQLDEFQRFSDESSSR